VYSVAHSSAQRAVSLVCELSISVQRMQLLPFVGIVTSASVASTVDAKSLQLLQLLQLQQYHLCPFRVVV